MRGSARRTSTPHRDWTTEVSSGFALAGFLALVFVGFTVLAMGPLISLDASLNLLPPPPGWLPYLHVLDRIGQRAVCLPLLGLSVLVACRHTRSWRPAYVAGLSVFGLNLLVLVLKVVLGRGQPGVANPAFFVGGMAYPSGHTANIVLVYGLAVYLLGHYRHVSHTMARILWAAVFLLSLVMVLTSSILNWHWFADLLAGLLVGGTVLQLTATLDAAVAPNVLRDGPVAILRALGRREPPHETAPAQHSDVH
jgi:membrane-associated phospholipid phosphatase